MKDGSHQLKLQASPPEDPTSPILHANNQYCARTISATRLSLAGEMWWKLRGLGILFGLLKFMDWRPKDVERVVTHQVGAAHRRLLIESLEIDPLIDFPTVTRLGNIGSVSLPLTYDLAERADHIRENRRVALLGIGSGLHCCMLAVQS